MHRYNDKTALIVVDMQNDFADTDGTLFVPGGDELIGPVNYQVVRAAADSAFVVYTQDWHPASTPHFQKDGGIWPVHCVSGTWGAELHPRLVVAGPTIRKGTDGEDGYSGFTMREPRSGHEKSTGLVDLLRSHQISDVVIVGLALDYCVGATALDAANYGLQTRVLAGHTAAVEVNPGDGKRMVETLRSAKVQFD